MDLPDFTVGTNTSGWGPKKPDEALKSIPYASFSKGEKLGRLADFGGYTRSGGFWRQSRYREANEEMTYKHDKEADAEFSLVDTSKAFTRKPFYRKRRGGGRRGDWKRGEGARGWEDTGPTKLTRKEAKVHAPQFNKRRERLSRARRTSRRRYQRRATKEASVKIETSWKVLEQYELGKLSKLVTKVPEGEDLRWAGSLKQYQDRYDRISSRSAARVGTYPNKDFFYTRAQEDGELGELVSEGMGNVFATDAVLAYLMCATRSVNPWDIVITVLPGGLVCLDCRDALDFEMHSVNETSGSPPEENDEDETDINSKSNLETEATMVQQNYSQFVVRRPPGAGAGAGVPKSGAEALGVDMEENPFWDEDEAEEGHEAADVAYRYRRWNLGGDINLIGRTTVHGFSVKGGRTQLTNVYALLEYDAKIAKTTPWRSSLDKSPGSVVAIEMQNNGFKMARWLASTMLSGADVMRVGFVSRKSSKSTVDHQLLGTQGFKPSVLAHQMSMEPGNMWGIIKWLVSLVKEHAAKLQEASDEDEDEFMAKFCLVRDPERPVLSLYSIPLDSFEEDDDEEEEEEDEE